MVVIRWSSSRWSDRRLETGDRRLLRWSARVQRQRIGITRAPALNPALVVTDEAVPTHPYTKALHSAIGVLDPDAPQKRIDLDSSSFTHGAPLQQVGEGHWAAM